MKNSIYRIIQISVLLPLLFCRMHVLSFAAVSGSGTKDAPVTGPVAVGDELPPDAFVKNLSETDGARIILEGRYRPNTYTVFFHAAGGLLPDGSSGTELCETYGEKAVLPEAPARDGKKFTGWFLKGNQLPEGVAGNAELLSENSIYYLAAEDPEEASYAELSEGGDPVAKAIWRNNEPLPADGYEADDPAGSDTDDLWDESHSNTRVIEWIPSLSTKEEYRKYHGKIRFQYGRARLDAGTDEASSYTWYIRRANEEDFRPLDEKGPVLTLSELTRADHDLKVRCEALLGEQGDTVCYETKLRVYWLPEIKGIRVRDITREIP